MTNGAVMPERTAILTALLLERPLCMACLLSKSAIAAADIEEVLRSSARVLPIHQESGHCHACGSLASVVSFVRPLGD